MNVDLAILKSFYTYQTHVQFGSKYKIPKENKELHKILLCIELYHLQHPEKNIQSTADLEIYFYTQYPATSQKEKEVYESLFHRIDVTVVDEGLVKNYINTFQEGQIGHQIALLGLEVSEFRKPLKDARIDVVKLLEGSTIVDEKDDVFVSQSLRAIADTYQNNVGLRWRLNILNKMLGSLRKGNFGFIFARPETGKTTFLASEAGFMAQQDKGMVLHFNNEQVGQEVLMYYYRAILGKTNNQLYENIEENEKLFLDQGGRNIAILDDALLHRRRVEELCQKHKPALIIFDQIDKIKGFANDRHDLSLGSIYQWARELSKEYGPVIGVCQAGEMGSNKRYLTMEDVVNAKTAKQAEADWILGIGKLDAEGYEQVRHLHLSKNKLTGDKDSEPGLRHGKKDVLILPEISRYKDAE